MAESAKAENGHDFAGACAAIAKAIESGDSGAKKRGGINGRKFFGNACEGGRVGEHIVSIPAVTGDAGDERKCLAGKEISTAAHRALSAEAGIPADPDAIANGPTDDGGADSVNYADNFVAGNLRIFQAGPVAFLDERIAVTDSASMDFDADISRTGLGDITFYKFKWASGPGNLDCAHLFCGRRHKFLRN